MTDQTVPAGHDLPEANDTSLPHAIKRWLLDAEGSPVVWSVPGGRVMIHRVEPGDLTATQARTFALNVLAAAAYSEGPPMTDQNIPADKKPAPALPDGWRLADHEDHGRVIVTTPTPDDDGDFYFTFPADDLTGYDWDACSPDELTYIDTGQEADQ